MSRETSAIGSFVMSVVIVVALAIMMIVDWADRDSADVPEPQPVVMPANVDTLASAE